MSLTGTRAIAVGTQGIDPGPAPVPPAPIVYPAAVTMTTAQAWYDRTVYTPPRLIANSGYALRWPLLLVVAMIVTGMLYTFASSTGHVIAPPAAEQFPPPATEQHSSNPDNVAGRYTAHTRAVEKESGSTFVGNHMVVGEDRWGVTVMDEPIDAGAR